MKKVLLFVLTCVLLANCGEKKIANLFTKKVEEVKDSVQYSRMIGQYTLLEVNNTTLNILRVNKDPNITISLPYGDEVLELELNIMNLFDGGFKVNSNIGALQYDPGVYYTGKIKGDDKSLVTISVFVDDITGVVASSKYGSLNLGKVQENKEYILYNDNSVTDTIKFDCPEPITTPELDKMRLDILKQQLFDTVFATQTGCITVDFELTLEVFNYFGGNVNAAINWITSLFSGVKTLYLNEGINIAIKSIYVWTTEDGYSDNAATALNQLKTKRISDPAFTGTLVHLVRGRSNNLSGIAYLDVMCVQAYRFSFSDVLFSYAAYPAYSWSTEVITHELGHNIASPHTQSCSWPGGAIDNCYTTEGGCPPGPAPVGGGTIMSYCHMTSYGINFAKGFGPLPGNLIRSRYAYVSCLTSCAGAPPATCSDGIKNGTETGIDCGGTCPPCPVVGDPIISLNKVATQSSNYMPNTIPYPASKAVDGIKDNVNNFSHTLAELKPWIEIDLGAQYKVTEIEIKNRVGCSQCGGRLKKFRVWVTAEKQLTYTETGYHFQYTNDLGAKDGEIIPSKATAFGRYIKLWADNGTVANYLNLAEITVKGIPSDVCFRDSIGKITHDTIYKVKCLTQ